MITGCPGWSPRTVSTPPRSHARKVYRTTSRAHFLSEKSSVAPESIKRSPIPLFCHDSHVIQMPAVGSVSLTNLAMSVGVHIPRLLG